MRLFIRFCNTTAKNGAYLGKKFACRAFVFNPNQNTAKRNLNGLQCKRFISTTKVINNEESFDEEFLLDSLESEAKDELDLNRNMLFKNSDDCKIIELNKCVSVEEVLDFIRINQDGYNDQYLTQTILVLRDIQNIYQHLNDCSKLSNQFFTKLSETEEFNWILKKIEETLENYNVQCLSYTLLYLYKLGMCVENHLLQKISIKIRDHLVSNFSLDICSQFFRVIFSEHSVRPYYVANTLIPVVINCVDKCKTLEDLENLTICLNKVNKVIPMEVLEKYIQLVDIFITKQGLSEKNYKILLKIILLLNYPQWRDVNIEKISNLMLFMKDEINNLTINEIVTLYKIFFGNQEPGEILNDIQRYSAKYLHQMEDVAEKQCPIEIKLQLFSSLMYFSSSNHRVQFTKDIRKYAPHCQSFSSLVLLRKIFSYTRISDQDLCQLYWDKIIQVMNTKESKSYSSLTALCQNYILFNTDIDNYRHFTFENNVLRMIENEVDEGTFSIYPKTFATILSFVILYGKSKRLLEVLIIKLEEIWTQMSPTECLYISYSLSLLPEVQNKFITDQDIYRIKHILNKSTEYLATFTANDFIHNTSLVKGIIYRNDFDQPVLEELLVRYKKLHVMSSKILKNICYCLLCTHTLIPEVINMCTEYVVKNNIHMLGFNAEKLLTLCYELAYVPINADQFFQIVTDVILRDQERLSGLSFLQSALALCFFNKLPKSIVKMIFNTEFLDKLDIELANCYSKDVYIHKVRNRLMVLNRAVCLEYPECNVPWFHKKYIAEMQKRRNSSLEDPPTFILRVKNYIEGIVGNKQYVLENVITPYGYHIDFVLHLNSYNEVVEPDCEHVCLKLAILLCKPSAYTQLYTHLKGKYQMKKRHLEILGYKVVIVKYDEWVNLLYAQERIDFVRNIIWPEKMRQ